MNNYFVHKLSTEEEAFYIAISALAIVIHKSKTTPWIKGDTILKGILIIDPWSQN